MKRRIGLATLAVASWLAADLAMPAQAQNYPSRNVTIVVSLAASTGMDAVARIYADKLSQALGKPVLVENSLQHMSMEFAKQHFGFDATHVPYRSTAQLATDLVAGHVAASFNEAGLSIPLVKEGKLRALAVTASQRLPLLPDTPPFDEAAGVPDYEGVSWHMLLAPSKTPRPIAERLHDEMARIVADPEVHDKIASIGLIPNPPMSIEEMQAYIRSERVKWGGLVKQFGLEGSQ